MPVGARAERLPLGGTRASKGQPGAPPVFMGKPGLSTPMWLCLEVLPYGLWVFQAAVWEDLGGRMGRRPEL